MVRMLGGVAMFGAAALLTAGSVVAAPRSVPPEPDAPASSAPSDSFASASAATEAADEGADGAPEPPPGVAPLFEQSGSGPQRVTVGALSSSALVDVTFEGGDDDQFTVTGAGANDSPTPFAIFATGTGSGRYLLPSSQGVESLDVQAVGDWTIRLLPLDAAREWDGTSPIDGAGNDVVAYTGGGGALSFTIDGDASSTITLVTYTPDGNTPAGFVLTQFGVLSGEGDLPPGPVLLDVGCADTWHLTIR